MMHCKNNWFELLATVHGPNTCSFPQSLLLRMCIPVPPLMALLSHDKDDKDSPSGVGCPFRRRKTSDHCTHRSLAALESCQNRNRKEIYHLVEYVYRHVWSLAKVAYMIIHPFHTSSNTAAINLQLPFS